MLFSMVVALMVILIGAFWAYQGFLSALIMFFECVVACMLAFGFYEPLASLFIESTGPGLGLPLSFMGIFLLSLLGMRTATDKMIKDNVTFPVAVDRGGAAVAGFFAGMIIVGSMLTAVQMLPMGAEFFGFARYTADSNGAPVRHGIGIFKPDDFTCALARMLSNDRFGGDVKLGHAKPDMIDGLYSSRAVPMTEENMFVTPKAVKVHSMWYVNQIDHAKHSVKSDAMTRTFQSESPRGAANTFLVVNVSIKKDASKKDGNEIRFRVPQFRVVGPPPGDEPSAAAPALYLACGMTDLYTHRKHGPMAVSSEQRKRLCAFGPTTDFILSEGITKIVEDGDSYRFDVAFEVPEGFRPWFLEFKRGGRADLTPIKISKEPPANASMPQGQGGQQGKVAANDPNKVGEAPGGTLHFANAIEERTDATDLLPIPLDKNDPAVAKWLTQGALGGAEDARLFVELKQYALNAEDQVEKFWVPGDKRMVQIGAEVLKQHSMYSRAIGFATRVLGQTSIKDEAGETYHAIGFYAAMEVDGVWKIEVQYNPAAEVPERALKQPNHLKHSQLANAGADKVKFGFLFAVPPGVKIVSFTTGKGSGQSVNIQVPE